MVVGDNPSGVVQCTVCGGPSHILGIGGNFPHRCRPTLYFKHRFVVLLFYDILWNHSILNGSLFWSTLKVWHCDLVASLVLVLRTSMGKLNYLVTYRVSHETWQLVNSSNVFFRSLIPKRIIKNILWQSSYSKMDLKIKIYLSKSFFNFINCKTSNTVYRRRHSKLFTNCHVSWDTLYLNQFTMLFK